MRRFIIIFLVFSFFTGLALFFIPDPGIYPERTDSLAIFDKDGQLLRLSLDSRQNYRLFAPFSEISPELIKSTIFYEDRFFYRHPGFNPLSLARAAFGFFSGSGRPVGASTITMQVARIRFDLETRNLTGKMVQILRAIQLERHYSKKEIMEAYLNLAPYGRNIEGVAAASLIYFGKKPKDLTVPEALALSVIPQNPCARCPLGKKGYKEMDKARQRLFERLVSVYPSYSSFSGFMSLRLVCGSPETLPFRAPHFCDLIHYSAASGGSGMRNTSLDLSVQSEVEGIINKHVIRRYSEGIRNAAALLVDSETMSVMAMAGSADFFNSSINGQVNAVTAKRSPGSALKPFVYALAIDQGLIHPMTLLKDAPLRYGAYAPENFDKRFQGPLSAKAALNQSRNVPALTLAARLSDPDIYDFLKLAGISGMKEKDFYGLSPVLGGCEVSMMEMAELYSMLANGGVMKRITLMKDADNPLSSQRILSPEASFMILDMLLDNPSPYSEFEEEEKTGNMEIAWKTGTSWGFRDAWAAGVGGKYVLVVWVGNFSGEGNSSFVGRSAAGPVFFDIMAMLEKKYGRFRHPGPAVTGLNLKKIDVCALSGGLPGKYTPKIKETWFIPGKSPITVSTIHRAIPIDIRTGLRACVHNPPHTRLEVFEFWPSDISRIFHEAGIYRPEPPSYMKGCGMGERDDNGSSPLIISPDSTVTYVLRNSGLGGDRVPLEATAENDVETLYWFTGKTFAGKTRPGEMLLWETGPGDYQVRVVDDHGRAAVRNLSVRRE